MSEAYICDAIRTPIGKYGGALAAVRTDDLAAIPLKALLQRNSTLDPAALDDVLMGCANQAGEDNRNVARMALLLAGLPHTVPGATINRLCGSGMDAVGTAARAIKTGEADVILAGGVESMTRAPFVMEKPAEPFTRNPRIYDTSIGWRFINDTMEQRYGVDSMMQTAENIASELQISRKDQDLFAFRSQEKAAAAILNGSFNDEILPVVIPRKRGDALVFEQDEHPRLSTREVLASLKVLTGPNGTITAGNSSGINDGAAGLLIASEHAINIHNLTPRARIIGMAIAGVPPRIMGLGPVPATQILLKKTGIALSDIDLIELNEAFAAQALGCLRELGMDDDDPRVNPFGGAIALGHPLGMSGARLITTAVHQLQQSKGKLALCTMCIGVGQGIAMIIEKV
ncbi:MAG: 3-oxoadipyl-CoA thiolase [Bacteroidales bacterium]